MAGTVQIDGPHNDVCGPHKQTLQAGL